MILGRRSLLAGLGAMLAAPAIVHAGNLMPIKALPRVPTEFELEMLEAAKELGVDLANVHDLRTETRKWADNIGENYRKSHPSDLDIDHSRFVRYEGYQQVWPQFQKAAHASH